MATGLQRGDGQPADVDCGCCGRFIGAELTCPYCGADAQGRTPVKVLRFLALFLAVGGLSALLAYARQSPVPLVRAAELRPGMSMAHVRVEGTVASAPRVSGGRNGPAYVNFEVDDGSGRITVTASRDTARALIDAPGALPRRGDRAAVRGRISLAPDRGPRLFLDEPQALRVNPGSTTEPSQ